MFFVCWVGLCTFTILFLLLYYVFLFGKHWWVWCPNGASAVSLRQSWLSELVVLILISEISDTFLVKSYEILPTLGLWVAGSCYSCLQAHYILSISGRTIMLYSIWFILWPQRFGSGNLTGQWGNKEMTDTHTERLGLASWCTSSSLETQMSLLSTTQTMSEWAHQWGSL